MRRELVATLAERPRTVVFVTHDIEEAVQLGDRVVVLGDATDHRAAGARAPAGSAAPARGPWRRRGRAGHHGGARPVMTHHVPSRSRSPPACSLALTLLHKKPWRGVRQALGRGRARRRVFARDLSPDLPGHRLRDRRPRRRDALQLAAVHRVPDGGRGAQGPQARRDVPARAAGDGAARAGRADPDRLPRPPRRLDGDGRRRTRPRRGCATSRARRSRARASTRTSTS